MSSQVEGVIHARLFRILRTTSSRISGALRMTYLQGEGEAWCQQIRDNLGRATSRIGTYSLKRVLCRR